MAEFRISKLRYSWKGTWNTLVEYKKDDVVRYGGSSYVCIRRHTSTIFYNDQSFFANPNDTNPSTAWIKMTDGRDFKGPWTTTFIYATGDIVIYGGFLYLCMVDHQSTENFNSTISNWATYLDASSFKQDWQIAQLYAPGDIVKYGGILYRCIESHTSSTLDSGLEIDINNWEEFHEGKIYRGDWEIGSRYKKNDLVKYGGTIFVCKKPHTPGDDSVLNFDQDEFWEIEFSGFQFDNEWSSITVYQVGDLVRHGGYLYISLTTNIDSLPTSSIYQIEDREDPIDWKIIATGIEFKGNWNQSASYKTGDVVRRGGNLYVALLDTEITADGSSLDYLDTSNWELVTDSINWRNFWQLDNVYQLNDVITFLGSTYKANTNHIASLSNYPGDNGSGFFYWDLLLEAGSEVGLLQKGDLLTYNLSRALAGDGSTFGSANVPIGFQDQVLTINNTNDIIYQNYAEISRIFYVQLSGVDDATDAQRGISPFKPFRTIRFAAEQADDEFSGPTIIKIAGGKYEEILPISIPKKTSVVGTELRTTEIAASAPGYDQSVIPEYEIALLNRISQLIQSILAGSTLNPAKSQSNTFDPVVLTEVVSQPGLNDQGEEIVVTITQSLSTGNETSANIQSLILDIISYINFYVNSSGLDPEMLGTNTAVTVTEYTNSVLVLEANEKFLQEECISFLKDTYPDYNFDEHKVRRNVSKYINAWKYDIIFTGNYKSLLAAKFYRNSVLGSKSDDMFYCRDTTGVRNCTITGLEGSLNPPNVFDFFRRPTGGAYVSLDPGWGPADDRTWIKNRSPYIQNVTTIGKGCIGQKIDGALHNGGNKSITSNDFTQVISDGIGAWVDNNGRAELVSVFSYYAHVGYLTTNGGIIRGTNGNCSYGQYGALSTGVDTTEDPLIATVNNRTQQAIVASAFSGDFVDEIQIVEWINAGQNYTQATGSVSGSGTGAEILFEDFRDDAVFESKLLDAAGDVRASFIGSITGNILTVTSVAFGRLLNGFRITGNGVDEQTLIVSFISGTGNIGTYQINVVQEVESTLLQAFTVGTLIQEIGGSGFTVQQNNAQTGDTTSITLATNDENDEANYLGMRVIITSGPGTGQYGYISAYDSFTKILQVSRESTDGPGWDHVVPGRPLVANLTTQSTYRIEPRPIFSDPGFTAISITSPTTADWRNIVYGETTESYNNIQGSVGTGFFVPDDGLEQTSARFNVVKQGKKYIVSLANGGVGYSINDKTIILGSLVGGIDGVNDIIITVVTTTDDSSNSIISFTSEGNAFSGKFVAITYSGSAGLYSNDGESWTQFNTPTSGLWSCLVAGDNRFVAIRENSSIAASSLDGITWTTRSMPAARAWSSAIYAQGIFFAVARNLNSAATSTNGISWTLVELPVAGDSSSSEWIDIAYGRKTFIVLANSNDLIAKGTYDNDTSLFTWTTHFIGSDQSDWVSVAYGNNRFVAISSQGNIAYSFDGENWLQDTMPSQDGSTAHRWTNIKYAQGVFFAVGDTGGRFISGDATSGPTIFTATSHDGVTWTPREFTANQSWSNIAFGNPYIDNKDSTIGTGTPMWVAVASNSSIFNKIRTGAKALGRVIVSSGLIGSIRIWDPGSGYTEKPVLTIVDPNKTSDAVFSNRIADGVLANPTWINRGLGYRTNSTKIIINGDGFADVIPVGKFITISNLDIEPGAGAQIQFIGNDNRYVIVTSENLSAAVGGLKFTVRFRVTPEIRVRDFLEHGTEASVRSRYSQVRITGHDFLDIGTGNFEQTNYPDLYKTGEFTPAPENEVIEDAGGRVFYTSTDQSGNFRTGELFAVEQATGVVTISADFFDFSGLTELKLGGIRVGGSGVVIREFSTDPLFSADSNNIVPTQRAVRAFLQNRLSIGGSELAVGSFIAGTILVGPNIIRNVAELTIQIPVRVDIEGPNAGISGSLLAQKMFFDSF